MKLPRVEIVLLLAVLGLWGLGELGEPVDPRRSATLQSLIPPGTTRLVPEGAASAVPVAALTLTEGRGTSWFIARSKGLWRNLTAGGALCEEREVLGLIEALVRARGLSEGLASELDLDALGFGPDRRWQIQLHGPQVLKEGAERDVLASVELAQGREDRGGPARRSGDEQILGLSEDLLPLLEGRGELPPLVSRRALPEAWPGWAAGLRRVFVDHADGESFQFVPQPPDPAQPLAPGLERFAVQSEGQTEAEANPVLGTGFHLFLTRAPRAALPAPGDLPAPELRDPEFVLTLEARSGEVLEVAVLKGLGPGRRVLIEDFTGSASLLTAEVARLLGPRADQLLRSRENPWDPYLR
jgi:hypothetical protein